MIRLFPPGNPTPRWPPRPIRQLTPLTPPATQAVTNAADPSGCRLKPLFTDRTDPVPRLQCGRLRTDSNPPLPSLMLPTPRLCVVHTLTSTARLSRRPVHAGRAESCRCGSTQRRCWTRWRGVLAMERSCGVDRHIQYLHAYTSAKQRETVDLAPKNSRARMSTCAHTPLGPP